MCDGYEGFDQGKWLPGVASRISDLEQAEVFELGSGRGYESVSDFLMGLTRFLNRRINSIDDLFGYDLPIIRTFALNHPHRPFI